MSASEYTSSTIEHLYDDHHSWLQGWLNRRLGNADDAADLAHDAFIRLIEKPRHFNSLPEARGYLCAMANGMCVDLWRRRSIEQAWLETLAARPETLHPSAEHQAMVLQALYAVDTMLRNLPAKAAKAFIMTAVGGMTYREAAKIMGLSERMIYKYVAQVMLHCMQLEASFSVPIFNTENALVDDVATTASPETLAG